MRRDLPAWVTDLDSETLDFLRGEVPVRKARTTMNAPSHPLEADLAAKFLPHCTAVTKADAKRQALGAARMLLQRLERNYRREQDDDEQ